jgi:hypothetical protein
MKFKNRILKFTSKSNLTIELDFIDGQELIPNLDTDKIDRFYYSTDRTGTYRPEDWYAEQNDKDILALINEFDLHHNKEIKTYGELISTGQDDYEPKCVKIGRTSLYFMQHTLRSFAGFRQFFNTKVETKRMVEISRSPYWDLLVDLAERNIFIRFPLVIKVEPGEILEYKELIINIYINKKFQF